MQVASNSCRYNVKRAVVKHADTNFEILKEVGTAGIDNASY